MFRRQPRFIVEGKKLTAIELAVLFFERMGYPPETLESLTVGRVHDRGLRRTVHVYCLTEKGERLRLGKIRFTNQDGASYTGSLPQSQVHIEEASEDDITTTFIGQDADKYFSELHESVQHLREEWPYTNFANYERLSVETDATASH
jgi:hypothetical protein